MENRKNLGKSLSKTDLKNIRGGVVAVIDDGVNCSTGSCTLVIGPGHTVTGSCSTEINGGWSRCKCVSGSYETDPKMWSMCNV
jgi:hypothetical protein